MSPVISGCSHPPPFGMAAFKPNGSITEGFVSYPTIEYALLFLTGIFPGSRDYGKIFKYRITAASFPNANPTL